MLASNRFSLSNFFISCKVKKQLKTVVFLSRWYLQKFDSENFFKNVTCHYLEDEWKLRQFKWNSMDLISRTRIVLLGCFQKIFSHSKVNNPKRPLAKIFQFFHFVPHGPNYHSSNCCAIKMIFYRERAKTLKMSHFKILRHYPILNVPKLLIPYLIIISDPSS